MCLALHGPNELGRFHSVARSGQESIAQGLPHVRQHKVLVLELEGFNGVLSTKDEGIFIFDEPLKILALN
jgi:hypothetical protein